MAGKCCGDPQLPKTLIGTQLVRPELIDATIGVDALGREVKAGDCLTTCDDLAALNEAIRAYSDAEDEKLKKELLDKLGDAIAKLAKSIEDAAKNLNQGTNLPADATDCSRPVSICGVTKILSAAAGNPVQTALVEAVLKKAQTDPVYRTALGGALLSKQAGNRIEVRADGIGVWDTAPPNLASQYVDAVNGNDNNAGTKDAPLKTVAQAIKNISGKRGLYSVWLKAGQTHTLADVVEAPNADIRIQHYGDATYGDSGMSGCYGYYEWAAEALNRPTLNHREFQYVSGYMAFGRIVANSLVITGVDITSTDVRHTAPSYGSFLYSTPDSVWIQGSDIYLGAYKELARTKTIITQAVHLSMHNTAKFANAFFAPNLTTVPANAFVQEFTCAGKPTFTGRTDNVREVLTLDNIGFAVNKERKQLLNGMTNWDIFANTGTTAPTSPATGGSGTGTGTGTDSGSTTYTASQFSVNKYGGGAVNATFNRTNYDVRGPVGAWIRYSDNFVSGALGGQVKQIGSSGVVQFTYEPSSNTSGFNRTDNITIAFANNQAMTGAQVFYRDSHTVLAGDKSGGDS